MRPVQDDHQAMAGCGREAKVAACPAARNATTAGQRCTAAPATCLRLVVRDLAVTGADMDPVRWQPAGHGEATRFWPEFCKACRRSRKATAQAGRGGAASWRLPRTQHACCCTGTHGNANPCHVAAQCKHAVSSQPAWLPENATSRQRGAHRTSLSGARPILVGCPTASTMSEEPFPSDLYALAPADSAHSRKTAMAPVSAAQAAGGGEWRRGPCRRAELWRELPLCRQPLVDAGSCTGGSQQPGEAGKHTRSNGDDPRPADSLPGLRPGASKAA